MSVLLPDSQLNHSEPSLLYVAPFVEKCVETLHAKTSVLSPTGRGCDRYPSVAFSQCSIFPCVACAWLPYKTTSYAIEQSFPDHADCDFSCLSSISSSRNDYGCYTVLTWNHSNGAFWSETLLALPSHSSEPLLEAMESRMVWVCQPHTLTWRCTHSSTGPC